MANEGIKNARGKITKDIIRGILAEAGFRTASVSPEYTVLCTAKASQDPAILVLNAFKEDCEERMEDMQLARSAVILAGGTGRRMGFGVESPPDLCVRQASDTKDRRHPSPNISGNGGRCQKSGAGRAP